VGKIGKKQCEGMRLIVNLELKIQCHVVKNTLVQGALGDVKMTLLRCYDVKTTPKNVVSTPSSVQGWLGCFYFGF